MKTLEVIGKTREYLEYVEDHVKNVKKAWKELQEKCSDMCFMWDKIQDAVASHDLSKLSEVEFVQYRKAFYPVDGEPEYDMGEAWEHHKKHNPHHWENWVTLPKEAPYAWEFHCVHMIIDWTAMGYKFGDTAQQYYESNVDKIKLPEYAIKFIYKIFGRLRPTAEAVRGGKL